MTRIRLEPRGDGPAPLTFREGAHAPFGIRWYGATSLWGHFRNFVASAIAAESVDSRDWMRALSAEEMLAGVASVLGVTPRATLLESLGGEPLWIDWVADTGDDRDVSKAVARMLFAEYEVDDKDCGIAILPRGRILLIGGDTAYPVATADEIHRRVVRPWNEVLREIEPAGAPRRVLLGIPGNHDWYDGLDGFARLFRRAALPGERTADPSEAPKASRPRPIGLVARGLHLDELGGAWETVAGFLNGVRALWRGRTLKRRRRLTFKSYDAVQESSYWALPLAPGLDWWGVDRQLRNLDFRQRHYFRLRRQKIGNDTAIWFVAPDPALAYGEPWDFGERMLAACELSLHRDRVLYQCGDMHHYERRSVAHSLHVIAGGGGAFLHGTRIAPDVPTTDGPSVAAVAYPDGRTTRRLVLHVPLQLMLGRSGYLVHLVAALLATVQLAVGWHSHRRFAWMALAVTVAIVWALYSIAGHRRAHPRRVLALAVPFGVGFGLLPFALSVVLHVWARVIPYLGRDIAIVVVYAFAAALLYGAFLTLCALGGLEIEQAFTVLGHPGFKHFVRMRVSPDGTVDAWAIGKDDPLTGDPPRLIDRWTYRG